MAEEGGGAASWPAVLSATIWLLPIKFTQAGGIKRLAGKQPMSIGWLARSQGHSTGRQAARANRVTYESPAL